MRYFLIMNPLSHGGKSKKLFNSIFEALEKHEIQYDYEITNDPVVAYELSRSANLKGYEVIVAVGGDGTINCVMNGFYDAGGNIISASKFGIIYTGTSPDFCKSYGIPTDYGKAVEVLILNKSIKIQIGKITFSSDYNKSCDGKTIDEVIKNDPESLSTRYFGCCVNLGIGARVARRANNGLRKYFGDNLGTFSAIARSLVDYTPGNIDLYISGVRKTVTKAFNISIGKTFYIASGIKVKNELTEGDSRFYCMIIRNINIFNVFSALKKIYSGKRIIENEVIRLEYGKEFDVAGNNQNSEIEFDGDPAGFLPCRIEMAEDLLELLCEVKDEK